MNETLFSATRQRLVALLAAHECEESAKTMYELELRLGFCTAHGFETGVPAELWYSLFEYMSSAPNTIVCAGVSSVERDETNDAQRIIHFLHHRVCFREEKRRILTPVDVQLDATSPLAIRVCAASERVVQTNVCADGRIDTPFFVLRRRERCSLYIRNADTNVRSCWRFDFTRIDEGRVHEIEIELELQRAVKQTAQFEERVRADAIMAQLRSLLSCLMYSIQQANAAHQKTLSAAAAEAARRREESERARREYFASLSGPF